MSAFEPELPTESKVDFVGDYKGLPFKNNGFTPGVKPAALGAAPLPFRVLYRLTRKRHAALAALALGEHAAKVSGEER